MGELLALLNAPLAAAGEAGRGLEPEGTQETSGSAKTREEPGQSIKLIIGALFDLFKGGHCSAAHSSEGRKAMFGSRMLGKGGFSL